jgi:DNA invertase Pin-like site-specific DNA recombinase
VIKAFGYLRVSGKGQIEGDGFPRQLQAIKAHAAANGISVVKVFREEGVSGSVENMDRPAWPRCTAIAYGLY